MKIKSTYGLIEVGMGRKALLNRLKQEPGVRVTIEAVITDPFGADDGIGQEFNMEVLSVKETTP